MNADNDDSNRKERTRHGSSRVWRTLLGAAIGAVLAMLFVPRIYYGAGEYYILIFDTSGKIDVPQLVLNVVFAALIGALAANLSRRGVYLIAACLTLVAIGAGIIALVRIWKAQVVRAHSSPRNVSTSQYATAPDFAKHALNLREQALLKVEPPILAPTSSRPSTQRFPWKTNIVTTVFWIGEKADGRNPSTKSQSAWDANWTGSYGGFDNPDSSARRGYIPIAFIPRQNPFYCALPYNDVTQGQFKPEAPLVIPWFKQAYTGPGQSVCWHRWVAIRKGNRTCYAQWEDCGPFLTDHFQYVFQNERPKPNAAHGAGLSVSPAVRDYLGLAPTDVTDWQFVEVSDVPPGPWRSYGENNHFVIARRQMEQKSSEAAASPSP